MHPYLTERMLHQSEALAPLGAIAVGHTRAPRRLGLPARALGRRVISRPARILAAADAYQAMRQPLHRPARSAQESADELWAEVKAGRLDSEAVEAVLGAAGHRVSRRLKGPAGLTARGRGTAAARPGALQQGDRRESRDLAKDRRQPHPAHLRKDQRLDTRGRGPFRDAARPPARGGARRGRSGLKTSPTTRWVDHAPWGYFGNLDFSRRCIRRATCFRPPGTR